MKKTIFLCIALSAVSGMTFAQGKTQGKPVAKWVPPLTEDWSKKPEVVTPGKTPAEAPSDAIVLFDGKDFSQWTSANGAPVRWKLEDGAMVTFKGAGMIQTRESFGDCQLHIEWRTPEQVVGDGQGRGNSGVFLASYYEVQVLDSYDNETYYNGQAGSIYKQTPPLVNACRKPGQWQVYDIIFTSPKFDSDGKQIAEGFITVIQNGVLIQNHTRILGTTEYNGLPKKVVHGEMPLKLQDHGNPVAFRNIWIRRL